ncbi:MAG: hypothetical protein ABIP77_10385 [Candidatus Limnocylindrales bacterium]
MTTERHLERDLPSILDDLAVGLYPDYVDDVLTITAHRRQRPAWTFPERWLPMELVFRQQLSGPRFAWRTAGLFVLLALALVAGTVMLVGALPRVPEPFGLARNGAISFEREGDIYVADEVGGVPRSVIVGPDLDFLPIFSLQGTRLLFFRELPSKQPMLMLANADGSAVRELAGPFPAFNSVDWAPDGSQIAIGWEQRGFPKITLVPTDGKAATTLDLDFPGMNPSWRPPNGNQLLFRGQPKDGPRTGLFLIGADGTDLRRLELDPGPGNQLFQFGGAAWSPDGTQIAFNRDDQTPTGIRYRIHMAEVDLGGTVIVDRSMEFDAGSQAEHSHRWSPDGEYLSFQIWRDRQVHVAVARADGTGPVVLTGPAAPDDSGMTYTWAPDGSTLLATYFANGDLWSLDAAGGEARKLGAANDVATWQRTAP